MGNHDWLGAPVTAAEPSPVPPTEYKPKPTKLHARTRRRGGYCRDRRQNRYGSPSGPLLALSSGSQVAAPSEATGAAYSPVLRHRSNAENGRVTSTKPHWASSAARRRNRVSARCRWNWRSRSSSLCVERYYRHTPDRGTGSDGFAAPPPAQTTNLIINFDSPST